MENGKAGGIGNIVVELLKEDLQTSTKKLYEIIRMIWEEEVIPAERLKGLIVKMLKKGSLKDCTNWRDIALLIIASKVLGKVIIKRVKKRADMKLRPAQA